MVHDRPRIRRRIEALIWRRRLCSCTGYSGAPSGASWHGTSIDGVERSAELTPIDVPLPEIRESDVAFWFDADGDEPTCQRVAPHAKLMSETDLSFPIILSQDGRVMDGMHRLCKALIEGRDTIQAVQFEVDPEPDYVSVPSDELPY
ncbi:MAG TPA: hypothetical protein VFG22_18755 [Polyangiales bacterium]|nr:hypothetical protein [Polyangiales bacterium]